MARLIVTVLAVILFLSTPGFSQKVMNFDKVVSYHDSDIVIQPPPGQTWTLLRGSFAVLPGNDVTLTIYEQQGNDPGLCTNLIRVELETAPWVPIVGGYVAHSRWGNLKGQDAPIVLVYPNRLVLHIGRLTQDMKTWVRFTIG